MHHTTHVAFISTRPDVIQNMVLGKILICFDRLAKVLFFAKVDVLIRIDI